MYLIRRMHGLGLFKRTKYCGNGWIHEFLLIFEYWFAYGLNS